MYALTLFHYYRNYRFISMFKLRQRTFYWLNYLPISFLKMQFLFFIVQILLVCLGHIAGSFFVNQCSECFLCFNIACICLLCTKLCGHIFLNRLLLLYLVLLLLLLFLLIVIITDFRLAFFHWDLSLAATVFHAPTISRKD